MKKEDLKVDDLLRQLPEKSEIWQYLTSNTNEKIIAIPILTSFKTFEDLELAFSRTTLNDFKRYFSDKFVYELKKIDNKTAFFEVKHIIKEDLMRSLLTILSDGLWIWLSFDKSLFKEIVLGKLIKYLPGLFYGSVNPKILEEFIENHVSEDSLNVISQRSPFVISKRTKLPSFIETKYGHEEDYKDYYSDREISISIKATKRWLKKKLFQAKQFANSEVISIQFKVFSPNPSAEVTLLADEYGVVEDKSHHSTRISPYVIANPFNNILKNLFEITELFRSNLPKIKKNKGISYYHSFGKCFKYEVELGFDNRSALEYDSFFIEKFFLGGVKEGWDYFSGHVISRNGYDFVAELFEKKFGGSFLVKLEIADNKLILFVLPQSWTNENSLFLLYNVLQRKLAWNINIVTCDEFPTDLIEGGDNFGYAQIS